MQRWGARAMAWMQRWGARAMAWFKARILAWLEAKGPDYKRRQYMLKYKYNILINKISNMNLIVFLSKKEICFYIHLNSNKRGMNIQVYT